LGTASKLKYAIAKRNNKAGKQRSKQLNGATAE